MTFGTRKNVAFWAKAIGKSVAIVFTAILALPAFADPDPVSVDGGTIQGLTRGGVDLWLGVPYAAPPVGDLRWRAPRPVVPWEGARSADTFGPSCMQPDVEPVSEDCLTINVYRPAGAEGPLPVMVWIHGGGYVRGGSNLYPMTGLAPKGVVVASINYRLGRFGFFAHPELAAEDEPTGNFGYLDQLAALEWVHRNIAFFGGDPDHVTIFGESAGAGSVVAHLVSPMSRDLFVAALAQSPAAPNGRPDVVRLASLEEAQMIAEDYAALVGATATDHDIAQALRGLPATTVMAGVGIEQALVAFSENLRIPGFSGPIIDGDFLVEEPTVTLAEGRQAPVPVLLGTVSRELALGPHGTRDVMFAHLGDLADEAKALYDPNGDLPLEELHQLLSQDFAFTEPVGTLANMLAASGQPTWLYRFDYVPVVQQQTLPGTPHGMEIPFTLNLPGAIIGADNVTESDQKVAETTASYWANFGIAANPNGSGLPNWPQHEPGSWSLLNITQDGISYGEDPSKATIDLWRRAAERN